MSSQFLVGVCVVLGALGTWNTWTLSQVNKRLDAIEQLEESPLKKKTSASSAGRSQVISGSREEGAEKRMKKKSIYASSGKTIRDFKSSFFASNFYFGHY